MRKRKIRVSALNKKQKRKAQKRRLPVGEMSSNKKGRVNIEEPKMMDEIVDVKDEIDMNDDVDDDQRPLKGGALLFRRRKDRTLLIKEKLDRV